MKKYFAILLVFVMCFSSMNVSAAESTEMQNVENTESQFTRDELTMGGKQQGADGVNVLGSSLNTAKSSYVNTIILDTDFVETKHSYGSEIDIPFFVVTNDGSTYDEYHVQIMDEDLEVVASYSSYFPWEEGVSDEVLTWTGAKYADPGAYYVNFWADNDTQFEYYVWVFYIMPQATINPKAASAGAGKVKVSWTKSYGADGYLVYAQKDGKYGYTGMTTVASSYTDKKALTDDYNFYFVFPYIQYTDVDSETHMIPAGYTKYVYARGICPTVQNVKARSLTGGVQLTWSASTGAEGYLIYGRIAGGAYKYIGASKGTSFVSKEASRIFYNYYWVFPFGYDASGRMVPGDASNYVYGRAL